MGGPETAIIAAVAPELIGAAAGTAAASSSTLSSGSSGTITVVPPVNGPRVMAIS